MDISALSQLSGGLGASAPAVQVPVDTRALVGDIGSSTALSDSEKSGLIAAVATIDSGLTGDVRASAIQQAQQLGIYLKNTNSDGYPRWPMMTALRAYGMNLSANVGTASTGQSAVVANLRSQLEQIAQGRGVTLQKAIAAASTLPAHIVAAPVAPAAPVQAAPVAAPVVAQDAGTPEKAGVSVLA